MKSNDYFSLKNDVRIPSIGFGTWQIPNGRATYDSVSYALECGYRHIDTALAYGNEESVGKAVKNSGIDRKEIFVTSKLPAQVKDHSKVSRSFEMTMENLGFDVLDLWLIHAPWPWGKKGSDFTIQNIEVWKAMEEIYESGKCRSIGVSNFNVSDLTSVMDNCKIIPMVNQIEFFIGHTQELITAFCKKNNILVEGYSPLATGDIINNKEIAKIARKYNVSVPQICIRYLLQNDVLPLPKSVHQKYIKENIEVDFEISTEDMKFLDGLKRTVSSYY